MNVLSVRKSELFPYIKKGMEQKLQSCLVSQWFLFSWGLWYSCPSIFQSTFLQAVNSSKTSILNWDMKLNFFVFLFLFCFWNTLETVFHSILTILTLWFRYLQTRLQESCLYISSQLFFKIPHETLKFREKLKKNAFSTDLQI